MSDLSIAPMTLGDIFDRLFRLIGKTWQRNLIIAAIFIVPAGLMMGIAADIGTSQLADMLRDRDMLEHLSVAEVSTLFGFAAWFAFGSLLLSLGTVAATVSITVVSCAEMTGETLSWQEALSRTFYSRILKVIGQSILESFLFVLLVAIPYMLLILGVATDSLGLAFFGGILLLVCVAAMIYLGISFAFTVPVISWEDADILESFKRSWRLVRDNWWRTIGILILMSLMVSFALSILMAPFYLAAMWDFIRTYLHALGSIGSARPDPGLAMDLVKSLGFGIGIVSGLASIAELLVAPLYIVVMYFDLRARHGEFAPPQSSPAPLG